MEQTAVLLCVKQLRMLCFALHSLQHQDRECIVSYIVQPFNYNKLKTRRFAMDLELARGCAPGPLL